MIDDDADRDLRQQFAHLRAQEGAQVPPLEALRATRRAPRLARGQIPRRVRAWAAATVLGIVVVSAFLLSSLPSVRHRREAAMLDAYHRLSAVASDLPTDFLLETPGRSLIVSYPELAFPRPHAAQIPDSAGTPGRNSSRRITL
jgi:hypothetical protein